MYVYFGNAPRTPIFCYVLTADGHMVSQFGRYAHLVTAMHIQNHAYYIGVAL